MSAFAKAPVGQSLWAKILIGIIIIVVIVVVCIYCPPLGAAAAGALAAGEALAGTTIGMAATIVGTNLAIATAAVAAAGAAAIAGAVYSAVDSVKAENQDAQLKREVEELRQKAAFDSNESHTEYINADWNYMEKITTDFDRDTMTCKRCVSARKCTNPKWHIFSNRNCGGWGKWEDPKCNDLKF